MGITFKLRRGPATEWTTDNPILAAGEPGIELDTGRVKIGNGVQAWEDLPYFINEDAIAILIHAIVDEAVLEGVPGASAYEVAVDNGFVGTEVEWLASLVGPAGADGTDGSDGDDGAPGLSAYQVAVNNGFVGTEPQWLASLVGADGADGTNGTNGSDGLDGDSAYDIAVVNGFVGTEEEWLISLVGAAGADGADGESITVTLVEEANWPPAPDGNPLHFYFRVPDA